MRVLEHFTDTGFKCAGCNYTVTRWYALNVDSAFNIEDGYPNWVCIDCMMEYILNHCELEDVR